MAKRRRRQKKRKPEWSKIFSTATAFAFGAFGIWSAVRYYNLAELAITTQSVNMPDASIAVTCIQIVIASLLSYLLYQAGLKNSRNKYGIDAEGQPFETEINQ